MSLVRRLDRYVFGEFSRLFLVTALGFPILVFVSDLASRIEEYMNRGISTRDLAMSYVYWIPDTLFMVLPAAVLMATVFTIANLTKHAELIAAKASGVSFLRMIMPVLLGAALASGLDLGLGALAPAATSERSRLLKEAAALEGTARYNFAFAGEYGRVYKAAQLLTDSGVVRDLQIERKGRDADYPTYVLASSKATYEPRRNVWSLAGGEMDIITDSVKTVTVSFAAARDRHFIERPSELMMRERQPHDLTYGELTRVIRSTERSGGASNLLRVERGLKLAVPVTCIVIALFGAPLATSTERGGSAYGVAVSLATTMIFLVMIQLTRAIGGSGMVPADFAAWIPNLAFGAAGIVLLARVRT
jgi:lipopolysaccharide export system permease protein